MLVRLTAKEVNEKWEGGIRPILEQVIAPTTHTAPKYMEQVFLACLAGTVQVFTVEDEGEVYGVVITRFEDEPTTKFRTLLIYAAYMWKPLSQKILRACYHELCQYAAQLGAKIITAYTSDERVADMLVRLADARKTYYVSLGLDTYVEV